MKVTIIGGGGRVGSCAAYALQCSALVSEIQILDANKDLAEGEALDLYHGSALAGDHKIYAGDYARAADSDIFLITAGLRRKPEESRLDLINRNVSLFVQILDSIKSAGFKKDAIIFVVSNPVDHAKPISRGHAIFERHASPQPSPDVTAGHPPNLCQIDLGQLKGRMLKPLRQRAVVCQQQ